MKQKYYIAIDLKSFYASVECVDRGLDPLSTNLVVADPTRTEKTICLAVTPSLKAHGVPSRPRLFEVISRVARVNAARRWDAPGRRLISGTYDDKLLREDNSLALDYIVAPPRMALYIEYSAKIYGIYLKYFSEKDIHVYSVDEVFIDVSGYLSTYRTNPRELAMRVILDVLGATGITATAGVGTNLYLAKVAMDIVAKKMKPDKNGVRIAALDEMQYRKLLWAHRPITDFWRIGRGYERSLASHGMFTMGDVAMMSLENEELLYKLFGVNAELLIDHAWGCESCTMEDIKAYRPTTRSLSSGQVLRCPYDFGKGRVVAREMTELLALDMVECGVATDTVVLTVGYDSESIGASYSGEISRDFYGRAVPAHAHGTYRLSRFTSSGKELVEGIMTLYDTVVDRGLLIRRINITVGRLLPEEARMAAKGGEQLDFFTDPDEECKKLEKQEEAYRREKNRQHAMINIRNKFGKNAILLGLNFEDGATTIERNTQIGGHKA